MPRPRVETLHPTPYPTRHLSPLYPLKNTPYVYSSQYDSRGYSQGDYADVLIILTTEFFQRTWCNPKDEKEILDGTKKLFDAWIWWDVYGFTLIEHRPLYTEDNVLSIITDDDVLESCWGFYGEDSIEEDNYFYALPYPFTFLVWKNTIS